MSAYQKLFWTPESYVQDGLWAGQLEIHKKEGKTCAKVWRRKRRAESLIFAFSHPPLSAVRHPKASRSRCCQLQESTLILLPWIQVTSGAVEIPHPPAPDICGESTVRGPRLGCGDQTSDFEPVFWSKGGCFPPKLLPRLETADNSLQMAENKKKKGTDCFTPSGIRGKKR